MKNTVKFENNKIYLNGKIYGTLQKKDDGKWYSLTTDQKIEDAYFESLEDSKDDIEDELSDTRIDSDFNKLDFYKAFDDERTNYCDFYDFYLDGVRDQKDAEFYIKNRFQSGSTLMDEVLDAFEADITNAIKEGATVVGLSELKEWYKDDDDFNETGTFNDYLKSFNTKIDEEDFHQLYLVNGVDIYVFKMKEA